MSRCVRVGRSARTECAAGAAVVVLPTGDRCHLHNVDRINRDSGWVAWRARCPDWPRTYVPDSIHPSSAQVNDPTARAITTSEVSSAAVASIPMNTLARLDSGIV